MEAHLASLHGSLDAIRAQCSASKSADSAPSYFTNAVLRPENVDILELIRDADQLEASMFAYPPEDVERERGAETPRAPQIKPVHIPTPLRRGVTSAPGEHSAQFYLLAAEKLMQSYHNAPRARKHIRMLLKRDGEVQRHIARYTATIEKAKQQPTPSKEKREPVRPRLSENTELRQVKSEIQREKMEILALENMLAELEAEDDTSDLAQVLQGKPEPASPAAPPVDSPHTRTPSKRPLGASVRDRPLGQSQSQARGASALRDRFSASQRSPEKAQSRQEPRLGQSTRAPVPSTSRTPAKSPSTPLRNRAAPPASPLAQSVAGRTPERRTPAAARMRRTLDGTPRPPLAQSVGYTPGRTDELRSTATPPRSPATPQRARAASPLKERSPAKPALLPPGTAPDPSAELERAAAQIWLHFGESLRYVAPAATAAPFSDTFTYLSTLECCGQDPATARMDGGASADDSMHAPSGISALSAQSSTLEPSAPLSVNTVVMAHILLLLFRTPAPHSLTLASVKTLTESWWRQRGQAIFRTTAATPDLANEPIKHLGLDAGEVDQKGDVLGSRAVYGLVSKKILRIHRVGGAAAFRFA